MASDSPDWSGRVLVTAGEINSIVQNSAIRVNGIIDLGHDFLDIDDVPPGGTVEYDLRKLVTGPPIIVERILLYEYFQTEQLQSLSPSQLTAYTLINGNYFADPFSRYWNLGAGAHMAAWNDPFHHFFVSEWRFLDGNNVTATHFCGNDFVLKEENLGDGIIPSQEVEYQAYAITESNIMHELTKI